MSTLGIRPARQLKAGNGIVINSGVISIRQDAQIEMQSITLNPIDNTKAITINSNSATNADALIVLDSDTNNNLYINAKGSIAISDTIEEVTNTKKVSIDLFQILIETLDGAGTEINFIVIDPLQIQFNDPIPVNGTTVINGSSIKTGTIQTIANNPNAPVISFDTANAGVPTPLLNSSIDILIDGNSVTLPYSDL